MTRDCGGGLEEFAGLVVDRYYQLVSGSPIFTVDFGGSIGRHEVKVCNTQLDSEKQFGQVQRVLDFGEPSSTETAATTTIEGKLYFAAVV
jgi:hypothetical protein